MLINIGDIDLLPNEDRRHEKVEETKMVNSDAKFLAQKAPFCAPTVREPHNDILLERIEKVENRDKPTVRIRGLGQFLEFVSSLLKNQRVFPEFTSKSIFFFFLSKR